MKAGDLMTRQPAVCSPDQTAQKAAQMMRDQDCGSLPVVAESAGSRIVGTVTDRDLAVRVLAEGKGPETKIGDVMSDEPSCCGPDDEIEHVETIMEERQVRRVPVVDDQGAVIGMISQADIARHRGEDVPDSQVAEVVERISRATGRPRA